MRIKRILIGIMLFTLVLIVAACASPTSAPEPVATETPASSASAEPNQPSAPKPAPVKQPSGPIKAKWVEPQVDGDAVSVPLSDVENNWNIHFSLQTQKGKTDFMAYLLDGNIYVRANVCPPCRSIGYSLDGNILVCDRCATEFKAKTGDGIKGACVDYPKASIPYVITDGNIVMKEADLAVAYQNTLKPGWP